MNLPPTTSGARSEDLLRRAIALVTFAEGTKPEVVFEEWAREAAAYLWWMDRGVAQQAHGPRFDPSRVYGRCPECKHEHGAEPCGEPVGYCEGRQPSHDTCLCEGT